LTHLTHGSLDQYELGPNGILIGSAVFAKHIRVTNTQTDIQTTLRVTSVATGRILSPYALRADDAA